MHNPGPQTLEQTEGERPISEAGLLEAEIGMVGDQLLRSVRSVLDAFSESAPGPQALARHLGLDKVLTSRVLKATRAGDPIAAAHAMPGPEPLRRLVKAAARRGADARVVAEAANAIDRYEILIRDRIGDRSLLDAILSAWMPEARREFELRRKQSVFKALSQLKGVQARTILATAIASPSPDGAHLDVAWVNGLIGLQRLRPGVRIRVSTRRLAPEPDARHPTALDGCPIEQLDSLLLHSYCSQPTPRLRVERVAQTVHYILDEPGFGPDFSADVVLGEVNRAELVRRVPAGSSRIAYYFAEVVPCAKVLQFDVLVHRDLYPGSDPILRIYDTSFEGVANLNDPARDMDRLDLLESIEPLGRGLPRIRSMDVPRYASLVSSAFESLGLEASQFRGYRCRIDYPLYGSQVAMGFRPESDETPGPA